MNPERAMIPARANVAIMVLQMAAIGACLYAAKTVPAGWPFVALSLGFGFLMNSVYAIIHEAEHGVLLPTRWANEAAGVVMSLFFPASFHLIRQGHLGHHLRNRSDDEAFDFYFREENSVAKTVQWYGILTGLWWAVVASSSVVVLALPFVFRKRMWSINRASFAFFDSFNPASWWAVRLEALAVISTHALIIWGWEIPPLRYLGLYLGFGFLWSSLQYVHHYGTVRHVTRGARNLWIGWPLDALLLNHNWHLTHHKHPTAPWTQLPSVGRTEDPEREFLLWHYLRMWKGPRPTEERVMNRYAGKLVQ